MKFTITLLILGITTAYLHASDSPRSSGLTAARARLRAASGRIAPEVPHTKQEEVPTTVQDLLDLVDDEAAFIRTLRKHLSNTPGCTTWDESCESSCSTWNTKISYPFGSVSELPGFYEPISCRKLLDSCYQNLRGLTQKDLDNKLVDVIERVHYSIYPKERCKAIALICQGANVNTNDRFKWTTLHEAASKDDDQFVRFLLKAGAHVDSESAMQHSPLHFTMWRGAIKTTQTLIEHGADVNKKSMVHHTPLMELASHCSVYNTNSIREIARLLLNAGAEMQHRNTFGTAFDIAQKKSVSSACKALADFLEDYEKQPSRIES